MTGSELVLDEVRILAGEHVDQLKDEWDAEVRPHVNRLIIEAAAVAVRAAAGEDVTTATIALDASTKNIAREQKARIEFEARELAFRAALAVITRLVAAA